MVQPHGFSRSLESSIPSDLGFPWSKRYFENASYHISLLDMEQLTGRKCDHIEDAAASAPVIKIRVDGADIQSSRQGSHTLHLHCPYPCPEMHRLGYIHLSYGSHPLLFIAKIQFITASSRYESQSQARYEPRCCTVPTTIGCWVRKQYVAL
jgi:hypothetical protein